MLDSGIRGLLQRVSFGLRGEAQCPAYVGRSAGLGTFCGEDLCFELIAGKAANNVGFVADLQGSKYCVTDVLEFRVAAVRLEGNGCSGLVIPAASR